MQIVIGIVIGLAAWFVFRILLGAELKFRPVFAVVCYAMLPLVLSTLMALAVRGSRAEADGATLDRLHAEGFVRVGPPRGRAPFAER